MLLRPVTLFSVVSALASINASPLNQRDEEGTVTNVRRWTPRIRLDAKRWTGVWSLNKVDHPWGDLGSVPGRPTYWNFEFQKDKDPKYVEERFAAYLYEPDSQEQANAGDKGWSEYRDNHLTGVDIGEVQNKANSLRICRIVTDPDANMGGYMVFNTTAPYLHKRGKTHGIMDYGCRGISLTAVAEIKPEDIED